MKIQLSFYSGTFAYFIILEWLMKWFDAGGLVSVIGSSTNNKKEETKSFQNSENSLVSSNVVDCSSSSRLL